MPGNFLYPFTSCSYPATFVPPGSCPFLSPKPLKSCMKIFLSSNINVSFLPSILFLCLPTWPLSLAYLNFLVFNYFFKLFYSNSCFLSHLLVHLFFYLFTMHYIFLLILYVGLPSTIQFLSQFFFTFCFQFSLQLFIFPLSWLMLPGSI